MVKEIHRDKYMSWIVWGYVGDTTGYRPRIALDIARRADERAVTAYGGIVNLAYAYRIRSKTDPRPTFLEWALSKDPSRVTYPGYHHIFPSYTKAEKASALVAQFYDASEDAMVTIIGDDADDSRIIVVPHPIPPFPYVKAFCWLVDYLKTKGRNL